MCDELGKDEYMSAYIEESGKTSLCSAASGKGCNERELSFIEKMKGESAEKLSMQLSRLEGMNGASMKPDLKDWLSRRTKILKQMTAATKDEL